MFKLATTGGIRKAKIPLFGAFLAMPLCLCAQELPRITEADFRDHAEALSQHHPNIESTQRAAQEAYQETSPQLEDVKLRVQAWSRVPLELMGLSDGVSDVFAKDTRDMEYLEEAMQTDAVLGYFERIRGIADPDTVLLDRLFRRYLRKAFLHTVPDGSNHSPDLIFLVEEHALPRELWSEALKQLAVRYEARIHELLLKKRRAPSSHDYLEAYRRLSTEDDIDEFIDIAVSRIRPVLQIRSETKAFLKRIAQLVPRESREAFRKEGAQIIYGELYQPTRVDRLLALASKDENAKARQVALAVSARLEQMRSIERARLEELIDNHYTEEAMRRVFEAVAAAVLWPEVNRRETPQNEYRVRLQHYRSIGESFHGELESHITPSEPSARPVDAQANVDSTAPRYAPIIDDGTFESMARQLHLTSDQDVILHELYAQFEAAMENAATEFRRELGTATGHREQWLWEHPGRMSPPDDGRIGELWNSWFERRAAIEHDFEQSVGAILVDEQFEEWRGVSRDLQRRQMLRRAARYGVRRTVDLESVLRATADVNPIPPVLFDYEDQIDNTLRRFFEKSLILQEQRASLQATERDEAERTRRLRRIMERGQHLVFSVEEVQKRYIDMIAGALPEETAERFKRNAWSQVYPELFGPSPVEICKALLAETGDKALASQFDSWVELERSQCTKIASIWDSWETLSRRLDMIDGKRVEYPDEALWLHRRKIVLKGLRQIRATIDPESFDKLPDGVKLIFEWAKTVE